MGHMLRLEAVQNAILVGSPADEFATLLPFLSRVQLVPDQILSEPGERPEHAYFLESGVVTIRDATLPASPIQVAIVGRESLVGCEALLRSNQLTPFLAVAQQPGTAVRIPIRDLLGVLGSCPSLTAACMAAVASLLRQTMETAASNARDSLSQRCIRLLLMIHDRIDGEEVQITHEALSTMLGVRRSGITLVATDLQGEGLVKVGRGRITILDRTGLERQLPKAAWQRAANHAPPPHTPPAHTPPAHAAVDSGTIPD